MAVLPPPEGMTEEDYGSIHEAVVETVRGRWFLAEYARRSRVDEVQEMLAAIGRLEKIVTGGKALPPPNDVSPHLRLLAQRVDEIANHLANITEDLRESGADPYLCDELDTQVRAIAGLPRGAAPDSAPGHSPAPQPALTTPEPRIALDAPHYDGREQGASSKPHPALPQAALDGRPDQALELRTEPSLREEGTPDNSTDTMLSGQDLLEPVSLKEELSKEEPLRHELLREVLPSAAMPGLPRAMPLQVSDPSSDPRLSGLAAIDRLSLADKLALFS